MASDNLNENYTTIVIHVNDVNDNPPVFDRPTYETQITEEDDRMLPKRVLQVDRNTSTRALLRTYFILVFFCALFEVLLFIFCTLLFSIFCSFSLLSFLFSTTWPLLPLTVSTKRKLKLSSSYEMSTICRLNSQSDLTRQQFWKKLFI